MQQASVLIIEDENIVADHLAGMVEGLGYQVIGTAVSGEEGLRIARERCPEVVLLDVRLAGKLDGIDTASRVRQLCDAAIIFVTAHSDRDTVKRASASGVLGYVLKPFDELNLAIQLEVALYKHQADKALRDSEARYRTLFNSIDEGFCILQMLFDQEQMPIDYRFVEINPAFEQQTGLQRALGRTVRELVPGIESFWFDVYGKVAVTGQPIRFVDYAESMDRWFDVYAFRIGEPDEHTVAVLFTDITKRKRTEEAMRASEDRFAKAFTASPDGLVISRESDGVIYEVNQSFLNMLEVRREQVIGRRSTELNLIRPEERTNALKILNQEGRLRDLELHVPRLAGPSRCVLISTERIQMAGEPLLLTIIRDITERKRAEEALKEAMERYEQHVRLFEGVASTTPDFVYLFDPQGRFVYANRRLLEVWGMALPDVIGRTCRELGYEQWHHDMHMREIARVIETKAPIKGEVPFKAPLTGIFGVYEYIFTPVFDTKGGVEFIAGTTRDVTERKDAESELRETREQLTILTAQLEQRVEERTRELSQSQDALRALARELNLAEQRERKRLAADLHDHLQQTLVLGKLKVGQAKLAMGPVPGGAETLKQLDDIFQDALTYTRTLVSELSPPVLRDHGLMAGLKWLAEYMKKHALTVELRAVDQSDPELPEDQVVLVFQSVRELLINSAKHAGTGQAVVSLERRRSMLHIEVRDAGKGFAAADVGAPSDVSSKFGLFSIRERMKALGGFFHIASMPGQGTRCELVIPLPHHAAGERAASLPSSIRPIDSGASMKRQGSIRVLLVDDHAMMRQGLRSVLEGYADVEVVAEAADGEQAIAAVRQFQPAVVVMDINMPRLNGVDATRHIKAEYPGILVIGLSVNADGQNGTAMEKAGAMLLLTKEAAVEQLYSAIQRAVNG